MEDSELVSIDTDSSSPSPVPPSGKPAARSIWHLPVARNAHFVGRDVTLGELYSAFRRPSELARRQALIGGSGLGKSQIALEYAHRHRAKYSLVWWLRAGDEATLTLDYAALARELFPGTPERHPAATRDAVRKALERREGWLLILDDTTDPHIVGDYVPAKHRGHVLITSRNPNWRAIASAFPVPAMERDEAIFFLRQRSGRSDSMLSVGQVAKALGDVPLALEQAAAFIARTGIGFDEYLRRFEDHWAELLTHGRGGRKQDAVAMSLEIVFRQLGSSAPASAELLSLLAFFGAEGFRKDWLLQGADRVGDTLAGTVGSPIFLDEALKALEDHSLIDVQNSTISIHRIVSALARERLAAEQRTDWSHKALRLMGGIFQFDVTNPATWTTNAEMLPHALAAIDYAQQSDVTVAAAAILLNRVGQCLFRAARYEQARIALDRALAIGYQIYGESNPRLSAITNNLGRVLMKLGDIAKAREHFEWALQLDERTYGPTHPHVAEIRNNYGMCLARLDQPVLASQQFERALAIYEGQFGSSHPVTGAILNNLGFMRMSTGELTEAWDLLQRALKATRAVYGPDHPDVASILVNLGDLLRRDGNPSEALSHYTRAVVIDEGVYGLQHPDLARDLSKLGALLIDMEDFAGARRNFERALQIDEAVFGADSPNLIPHLNGLGRCLKQFGEVDAAADCFARLAKLTQANTNWTQAGGGELVTSA